jgi:7-cyano-7-deazaguanine synthase
MDKVSKIRRKESIMKAIVLFSGGLDSTTCLALAIKKHGKENVIALSLSYGQKHIKEQASARKIAKYYNIELLEYDVKNVFEGSECNLLEGNDKIPEGDYKSQIKASKKPVSTYVPFRNGLFLSIATAMAMSRGCNIIYYGIHKDDAAGNAYPDCSYEFNTYMEKAINTGSGGQVDIVAPFVDKNKAEIVKTGLELNVPYEMTWSCYNGGESPCGKCGTCIDRLNAFKLNGKEDPLCKK